MPSGRFEIKRRVLLDELDLSAHAEFNGSRTSRIEEDFADVDASPANAPMLRPLAQHFSFSATEVKQAHFGTQPADFSEQ
jgi:hypothetical protein